ncbi:Ribosomal RNA large subunit methyltransferase N [Paracholeplasma brassicae]|uniref:Probable dual-specificity RNA methyltransferase RlmN n=1 Tax=Acholeplasma brassicae TaxID=61635 RepID=U4KR87_9MOLU|nr:23S rRNA (adenine(2503)-C(2))-methyltransferase RlmN [Paracholeplasma brassicae]CCV65538.1 Ribosomal RNA large subunit methyltransferase N [Paracholeplasma brassicae]
MKSIYDLSLEDLQDLMVKNNEKKFRAEQIFDWIYKKKVTSFDDMKNVSGSVIELLKNNYVIDTLEKVMEVKSVDGTIKYLYALEDGNLIETVLMNHDYGYSICVTSQVGCNMGCKFCASGVLKKKRNLTAGEIMSQIVQTERSFGNRISYVVVMGIGEPFDNYENLMTFLRNANHPKGLEIGARHMTVSTCGIVPKIKEYADEQLQINLAISLHAPNNDVRNQIMPINKAYPIEQVIEAIRYYMSKTNRRVTIEYIMIKDLNDQKEHALELLRLLKGLNVYVNLIPYNEVLEAPFKRSSREDMDAFYDTLKKGNMNCTLRKEQGHDINAACGQLRSQNL